MPFDPESAKVVSTPAAFDPESAKVVSTPAAFNPETAKVVSSVTATTQDENDAQVKSLLKDRLTEAEKGLKSGTPEAEQEYLKANEEYRKNTGLIDRVAGAWHDADFGKSAKDFLTSTAKGLYAVTPMGVIQHSGEAADKEIEARTKAGEDLSAIDRAGIVLKSGAKEAGSVAVGAVHGAGDILMMVPAAINKGASEIVSATGNEDVASALDLGRKKITGQREEGIEEMQKAAGGSEEAASGGRLVGGFAPIAVPGVGSALSTASDVLKPIGETIQKAITKTGLAGAGLGIEAAGVSAGLAADVGATEIPYVGSASLLGRQSLGGLGKYLRAGIEEVKEAGIAPIARSGVMGRNIAGLSRGVGSAFTDAYAELYSKGKDLLLRPFEGPGAIVRKASLENTGNILEDLKLSGEKAVQGTQAKLADLTAQRAEQLATGIDPSVKTVLVSKIANTQSLLKSMELGQRIVNRVAEMPTAQAMAAIQGKIGDSIAHAVAGAGIAAGLTSGSEGNPFESIVPGAFYGTTLMLLGKAANVKVNPETGIEEVKVHPDDVKSSTADIIDSIDAKEVPPPLHDEIHVTPEAAVVPESIPEPVVPVEQPVVEPVRRVAGKLVPKIADPIPQPVVERKSGKLVPVAGRETVQAELPMKVSAKKAPALTTARAELEAANKKFQKLDSKYNDEGLTPDEQAAHKVLEQQVAEKSDVVTKLEEKEVASLKKGTKGKLMPTEETPKEIPELMPTEETPKEIPSVPDPMIFIQDGRKEVKNMAEILKSRYAIHRDLLENAVEAQKKGTPSESTIAEGKLHDAYAETKSMSEKHAKFAHDVELAVIRNKMNSGLDEDAAKRAGYRGLKMEYSNAIDTLRNTKSKAQIQADVLNPEKSEFNIPLKESELSALIRARDKFASDTKYTEDPAIPSRPKADKEDFIAHTNPTMWELNQRTAKYYQRLGNGNKQKYIEMGRDIHALESAIKNAKLEANLKPAVKTIDREANYTGFEKAKDSQIKASVDYLAKSYTDADYVKNQANVDYYRELRRRADFAYGRDSKQWKAADAAHTKAMLELDGPEVD